MDYEDFGPAMTQSANESGLRELAKRIERLETEITDLKKSVIVVRYLSPNEYTTQPETANIMQAVRESGDSGAATLQSQSAQSYSQSQD